MPAPRESIYDAVRPAAELAEVERLLALIEVAHHVDGFVSLDEAISRLCHLVLGVMNCAYSCVRLPEPDGRTLRIRGASDVAAFAHDEFHDLPVAGVVDRRPAPRPPSVEAFLTGRVQLLTAMDNQAGELVEQRRTRELGIRSMVALPLLRQGQIQGVLNCYWKQEFEPSEAQLLTAQVVGRLIALALETARRQEQARRELEEARGTAAPAWGEGGSRRDASLAAAYADLVSRAAAPAAIAMPGILQSLADRLRRSIVLRDAEGRAIASHGAPDQVEGLLEGTAEPAEARALTGPHGLVGQLQLGPAADDRDDEAAAALVSFAAPLLALLVERNADTAAAARLARPYALLALCGGALTGQQATACLDVLGIGSHTAVELAVARFETPEAALRFASQAVPQRGAWADVIASVAAGREAVLLLDASPLGAAPERSVLVPTTPSGRVSVGLSRRFSDLGEVPRHLEQARFAAIAGGAGQLVRFSDLGAMADMGMYIPRHELAQLVERRLGAIKEHDRAHDSGLLDTLCAYVDSNGSAKEVAERLMIHRNTVNQRLRRIRELCGADLASYDALAEIILVLQWDAYLREGPR